MTEPKKKDGFNKWYANVSKDLGLDPNPNSPLHYYDYKGFYNKYGDVDMTKGEHFTDEFKKPGHPTFSDESIYSNDSTKGGKWFQMDDKSWMFEHSPYTNKHYNKTAKYLDGSGENHSLPEITIRPKKELGGNLNNMNKQYKNGGLIPSTPTLQQPHNFNGSYDAQLPFLYRNVGMMFSSANGGQLDVHDRFRNELSNLGMIPSYSYGGWMHDPKLTGYGGPTDQYGFGSWLKKNIGTIGSIGGKIMTGVGGALTATGVGAVFGAPLMAAGALASGLGDNYNDKLATKANEDAATEQLNADKLAADKAEKANAITSKYNNYMSSQSGGTNPNSQQFVSTFDSANGGFLDKAMAKNPNATYYDAGGTHESNANGGIQLGKRGRVEEGEFKFKLKDGDFIFSNRF